MRYKWYALGFLLVLAMVNYIDRFSIYILQIQIKQELHLTDTQLGALTGIAFSLVYTLVSIPVARLADRKPRKYIIAASLALWSIFTALCGFATGFLALVILRMAVAVGEAGSLPASHALIADYFERHQRATALAIWSLSLSFGPMVAFALSGWLGDVLGWRKVFIVIGLAGLFLTPLVLITLKEPQRGATDPIAAPAVALSFWASIRVLWRFRSLRHIIAGGALSTYVLLAVQNWNAPFYSRVHGASLRELGTFLALITGAGAGAGMFLGGVAADRFGRADARWRMLVPMIGMLGFAPLVVAQYFAADLYVSLLLGGFTLLFGYAFYAPTVACVQILAPANLRALAAALMATTFSIVGMSLGPLVVGMISDYLIVEHGMAKDSLRYAMASCAVFALWAAFHHWRAAQLFPQDLERIEQIARAAAPDSPPSVSRTMPSGEVA